MKKFKLLALALMLILPVSASADEGMWLLPLLDFTNHHCGYGSIQKLSSTDHDYLRDGYWAMSRDQELPAPGLTVTFIDRFIDVTDIMLEADKKAEELGGRM